MSSNFFAVDIKFMKKMVQNSFKTSCLLFVLASFWTQGFSAICDDFFQGANKFPPVKNQPANGVVKLCQNDLVITGDGNGKALYATLFDTTSKIPIYSANAISINPSAATQTRPSNTEWERVSSALCVATLPNASLFYSRISAKGTLTNCDKFQALDSDYKGNTKDLTRGHLCPNSIMKRDKDKQLGTFTLTNAAPQFAKSNQGDWRRIECVTEKAIETLVPNEKVYVITGVSGTYMAGSAALTLNNRVATPAKYWKLVCYPGTATKAAWAFGIVADNKPASSVTPKSNYKTLKSVATQYFDATKMPFTDKCLNAPLGAFKDHLDANWDATYGTTKACK